MTVDRDSDNYKAFEAPYLNPNQIIPHFKDFILNDILLASKNAFTVNQSSGYGKSRLAQELGRENFNVVYIGAKSPCNTSGYPLGERLVIDKLEKFSQWQMEDFILAVYFAAFNIVKSGDQSSADLPLYTKYKHDHSFSDFWRKDYQIMLENIQADPQEKDRLKRVFAANQKFVKPKLESREYPEGRQNGLFNDPDNDELVLAELIIVFDESSVLMRPLREGSTLFQNIQEALKGLKSINCIACFIDTVPNLSQDSLTREEFDIPLFYEVLTYNVGREADWPAYDPRDSQLHWIFSGGRPLWHAYFFQKELAGHVATIDAISYAMQKLAYSIEGIVKPDSPLSAVCAVLAVRFGAFNIRDRAMASDLVSGHMATCMYVSPDRQRIVAKYPAEPVLSEAACQLIHLMRKFSTKEEEETAWQERIAGLLNVYLPQCRSLIIDAGHSGEFAGRVLLSLAYDRTVKGWSGRLFTETIPVAAFLDKLVSPAYKKLFFESVGHELFNFEGNLAFNGEISFTTFSGREDFPPMCEAHLKSAFESRTALMVRRQKDLAVNVMIPVRISTGTEYRYSKILVCMHNCDFSAWKQRRMVMAYEELAPSHCNTGTAFSSDKANNYIAIYMEPSTEDVPAALKGSKDLISSYMKQYPSHLLLLGLDPYSGFVSSDDLKSSLSRILKPAGGFPDPISQLSNPFNFVDPFYN